jgi:heat shock transcription factor
MENASMSASPSAPAPFLTKLYKLVDDSTTNDTVCWAFVVEREAEFIRDILPKYFKHSTLASFTSQLHVYVSINSAALYLLPLCSY